MTTELSAELLPDISCVANADLSSSQYYLVKLTASNTVDVCADTDFPIGVLQNTPTAGQAALVRCYGLSKVSSNEALTIGACVGSSADGQGAIVTEGSGIAVWTLGRVIQTSSAAAGLACILITHEGRSA